MIPFNIFKTATRPHKEIIYLVLMCTTIAIKTDKHRHVVSQYADHSHPVTNIQYNKHVSVYFLPLHTQDGKKKNFFKQIVLKAKGQANSILCHLITIKENVPVNQMQPHF